MRYLLLLLWLLVISGCTVFKQPAEPIPLPEKPRLQQQVFSLHYATELAPPRVKSVQLPAHPLKKGQGVYISADNVGMTDRLKQHIETRLKQKGLVLAARKQADYVLTFNQLEIKSNEEIEYQVIAPNNITQAHAMATQYPVQRCANITGSVSMKLAHKPSGDVVWFAKASVDSASFFSKPLVYQFEQHQVITNEKEVIRFIQEQNTDEARRARAEQGVTVPQFQIVEQRTIPQKVSGPCRAPEVAALVPDIQAYLSTLLLDKVTVK